MKKIVRFYFRKLVPDKVVHYSVIDPKNKHVEFRVLEKQEHLEELAKKIKEEADETAMSLGASKEKTLGELADLQIAIDEFRSRLGFAPSNLGEAIDKKLQYRGGLSLGHYVEYIDMDDDSKWAKLFRERPDKYTEEEI